MTSIKDLLQFGTALIMTDRLRAALLVVLLLAGSILQSFSILLLVPMLTAIGFNLDTTTGADASASGAIGWFIAAIDKAVTTINFVDPLTAILIIFVCVLLVRDLVGYHSRILTETVQQDFYVKLRSDLYHRLIHATWSSVSRLKSHEIAYHLTTNMGAIANITRFTLQAVISLVAALAFGTIAIAAAPQLVLILAVIGLLLFIPLTRLMRRTHKQAQQLRDLSMAHEDRGQQFVKRHRQITNFDNQSSETDAHAISTQSVAHTKIAITRTQAKTSLLQSTVAAITLAVTVLIAIRVLHIAPANLLLLIFAASRLFPRLMQLQYQAQAIFVMLPAYDSHARLVATLQQSQAPDSTRPFSQINQLDLPPIHLDQRLEFAGSLTLKRGEITCLTGPSGSGKSTICDVVAGLLPGAAGGTIDGAIITEQAQARLQRSVTYLEQSTTIWQRTVREALLWSAPDATDAELLATLNRLGLLERVQSQAEGLDAPLGDGGHWLSGGELKRLALGQALLRRSCALILDEFTANLDDETEQQVLKIINESKDDRITLIASHRPAPLEFADTVYQIERGETERRESRKLTIVASAANHSGVGHNHD